MVNNLARTRAFVTTYVVLVGATLAALVVLSASGSSLATSEAWGHMVVVGVFAVLLVVRVAAAQRGSERARRAVGVIAVVLAVVNLVEALLPGVFPVWLRIEMVLVAVLMVLTALSTRRAPA